MSFNIYLAGLPANVLLAEGSQITVSFTRQTITPLIATVISREKALEDTKNSILQNPTNADTTTTGESYITLSGDETLQSIQSNFTVLSQIHRHNIDVDIEWEWKADNELHKDYVKIEKVANPRHKAIEIRNRPENDFTGSLNFVIKYTYTVDNQKVVLSSKQGTIPVTFYGTGKPPRVMPMQSHTGQQGQDDLIQEVTEFTQTMNLDVYTGNPAYADKDLWDDAPTAPYKLTTSLYYGDGRGRAEYAIIYQNSAGGEFEVYLDGTAIPYKFGEKIENIGNYRAIEILAKKKGQSFFRVEFYNAKKELMGQNIFNQNFYIEDSTPNDDGTLESLVLKGDTVLSNKETIFEQVYPNRIIDFGFKPDTNAYTIKLDNCVEKVTFTPKITVGSGASTNIYMSTQADHVVSGHPSKPIALEVEIPQSVKITVTAQDGSTNSYTLTLLRVGPSSDAELSSFEAYPDTDPKTNLITGFAPKTYDYAVTVPYSVQKMTVSAVPNCPWVVPSEVSGQKYTVEWNIRDAGPGSGSSVETISLMERIVNFFKNSNIEPSRVFNINRPLKGSNGLFPESAITEITATVTAEDGFTKRVYKLTVTCMAPSTDNLLQSLSVSDINGTVLPYEFNTQFRPDLKEYLV
ncbi:MAG: cadherin-like beta sandwich domain-containing protein, partial [Oscillospiraceae bacterium]|nr:cadherin-like beta sandwich domain-containing protein [Oscillospiraceae bacterium]